MTNYDEYFVEQMKNEEFRKEYEALEPEFEIIQSLIDARNSTGIAQSDISKLENGNANPSIKTLQRLANAMGKITHRICLMCNPKKNKKINGNLASNGC